jgi:hypothetical protein
MIGEEVDFSLSMKVDMLLRAKIQIIKLQQQKSTNYKDFYFLFFIKFNSTNLMMW